ncbi:PREDICTED: putative mediator of RNA polymerase II transcription subunit 12, partial [Ceratosolen solmsi marchali]|uniref:Mediator of RNA polymerase II transcription subunit 12 n=1 Tax=Ceratosolen solmsi marchali TaxID=326594 RepID=A0AAJ6YTF1_9HYME
DVWQYEAMCALSSCDPILGIACSVPLTKGDHFGMRDGTVLCRMHYEMGAELHPSQSPPVPVYPPGPHYPGQSFPSSEFLHAHHPHHLHHHSHIHRPIHPNQQQQQQQQQQQ